MDKKCPVILSQKNFQQNSRMFSSIQREFVNFGRPYAYELTSFSAASFKSLCPRGACGHAHEISQVDVQRDFRGEIYNFLSAS